MRSWIIGALSICLLILAGCESDPPQIPFSDINLDVADAGSGEKLYQQSNGTAPSCLSCHQLEGTGGIGPAMEDYANQAGERVAGQSAEEYTYWSIIRPARYLVAGFSNVMYPNYDKDLTAEDMADLIAYVLTLE